MADRIQHGAFAGVAWPEGNKHGLFDGAAGERVAECTLQVISETGSTLQAALARIRASAHDPIQKGQPERTSCVRSVLVVNQLGDKILAPMRSECSGSQVN